MGRAFNVKLEGLGGSKIVFGTNKERSKLGLGINSSPSINGGGS